MPSRTSCSSESRFHRGSEWGMQYLEPSPQSWLLTYLRGNLPSTFSVEAGALPSSTQHRSPPISRNAKFASSILLFIQHRTLSSPCSRAYSHSHCCVVQTSPHMKGACG